MAYALRGGTRANERQIADVLRARRIISNLAQFETLEVSSETSLSGETSIEGTLDVSGESSFQGVVSISGETSIEGTLDVSGTSDFYGDVTIEGDTFIEGSVSISGPLDLSGDLTIGGNLIVLKTTTTNETVYIREEVVYTIAQDFEVDVCFNQSVTILDICDGRFWSQVDASFNHNVDISDSLFIGGDLDVCGDANVYGNLQALSSVLVQDNLDVCGDAHIYGDLRVDASLNFGPSTVSLWEDASKLNIREVGGSGFVFDFTNTDRTVLRHFGTDIPQFVIDDTGRIGIGKHPFGFRAIDVSGVMSVGSNDVPNSQLFLVDDDVKKVFIKAKDDNFTLETSGTDLLLCQTAGAIGIGTIDPLSSTYRLDVNGSSRIRDNLDVCGDGRVYGDFRVVGNFNIGPASITMWEDSGKLIIRETAGQSMSFDFSGDDGINTNNKPINVGTSTILGKSANFSENLDVGGQATISGILRILSKSKQFAHDISDDEDLVTFLFLKQYLEEMNKPQVFRTFGTTTPPTTNVSENYVNVPCVLRKIICGTSQISENTASTETITTIFYDTSQTPVETDSELLRLDHPANNRYPDSSDYYGSSSYVIDFPDGGMICTKGLGVRFFASGNTSFQSTAITGYYTSDLPPTAPPSPVISGSLEFSRNLNSYVTLPSSNTAYQLGDGAFALEWFQNLSGHAFDDNSIVMSILDSFGLPIWYVAWGGIDNDHLQKLSFWMYGALRIFVVDSSIYPLQNKWLHIALVRDRSFNLSLYIDGVLVETKSGITNDLSYIGSYSLTLGNTLTTANFGNDRNALIGRLSNIHIVNGNTLFYSGNTTIRLPTETIRATTGSRRLYVMSTDGNKFKDEVSGTTGIPVNNGVIHSTDSPFI